MIKLLNPVTPKSPRPDFLSGTESITSTMIDEHTHCFGVWVMGSKMMIFSMLSTVSEPYVTEY